MSKSKRNITVKINFSEDDVQSLLDAANFDSEGALQVKDLTGKEFAALKKEIQSTPFNEMVLDIAEDLTADDWLCEWGGTEE